MVTSVPSFSRGASVGNAIAQGMQSGLNNAMPMVHRRQEYELEKERQQYQRSQLQQGLDATLKGLPPDEQSRLQTVFGVLKAGAGIPGFDRTLSTLLPQLMKADIAQKTYGNEPQGSVQGQAMPHAEQSMAVQPQRSQQVQPLAQQGGMQGAQQMQQPQQQGQSVPQSGLANTGLSSQEVSSGAEQPQMEGGILPRVASVAELEADANRKHILSGGQLDRGSLFAQGILANDEKKKQRAEAEAFAKKSGVSDRDLPEFMELSEKFADAKNIPTWYNKTQQAFKEYKSAVTAIEGVHIPGWINKGERKQMLNRIGKSARIMKKMGREDLFRQIAPDKFGMSPLEVEEELNPPSKVLKTSVKEAPQGRYNYKENEDWKREIEYDIISSTHMENKFAPSSYDTDMEYRPQFIEEQNKNLASWMKRNIGPEDSLLVARDMLIHDKDYDWRQFGDALEMAMQGDNPLNLTSRQIAESAEAITQAPRDSIGAIFTGWERPLQRAKGVR